MKSVKKNNITVVLTKGNKGRTHRMSLSSYESSKDKIHKQGWKLADDKDILKPTDKEDEFIIKN